MFTLMLSIRPFVIVLDTYNDDDRAFQPNWIQLGPQKIQVDRMTRIGLIVCTANHEEQNKSYPATGYSLS